MKHLLITIHNGYCMQVLKEICLAVATINGMELSDNGASHWARLNLAFKKVKELVDNHNEHLEKDHRELVIDSDESGEIIIKNKHLIAGEPDHPILLIFIPKVDIQLQVDGDELTKQIGGFTLDDPQ